MVAKYGVERGVGSLIILGVLMAAVYGSTLDGLGGFLCSNWV